MDYQATNIVLEIQSRHIPWCRRSKKYKCLCFRNFFFFFLLPSNFFFYAIFGKRGGAGRSPRHHFLLFLKGMVHTPPFPANKGGAIRGEEKEMLLWCQSFLHLLLLLLFPFANGIKKHKNWNGRSTFAAGRSHLLETLAGYCVFPILSLTRIVAYPTRFRIN